MALPAVTPEGKTALDELLARHVAAAKLPALFLGVANADDITYFACAGDRILGQPDKGPVDENTTLQMYSMTKFVTSLAVLQLVEQGKVDLDDGGLVEKHLPELARQPIFHGLDDGGRPIEKQRTKPITTRHLLTHTSGLAYGILNPLYASWYKATGRNSWSIPNPTVEDYTGPLLFEPGEGFSYGTGIDFAGFLVERISGLSLDEYFKANIFEPLGIKSMTFFNTPSVMDKLMTVGTRDPSGKLVPFPGLRDFDKFTHDKVGAQSGGAGLYGTAKDYLRLLQGVLACRSPGGILKPETYKLIFEDSLPTGGPHQEQVGKLIAQFGWGDAKQLSGETSGHSVAAITHAGDSEYGRKKGSASWGGIYQSAWWIDPQTGIAAVCCTQILEQDPTEFKTLFNEFERTVYKGIA